MLFTRELTIATFDGIQNYHDSMDQQLALLRDKSKDEKLAFLEGKAFTEDEYWSEYNVAMQEHSATHEMLFANFFRYSLVTLTYVVVENKLGELCGVAHRLRGMGKFTAEPKKNVINEYKIHVTNKLGIDTLDWEILHDLNKIRNCIVHRSGYVKGFRQENHLRHLATQIPGLHISSFRTSPPKDIEPLYLQEDMLVMERTFCTYVIERSKSFFISFLDAIPVRNTLFKTDQFDK